LIVSNTDGAHYVFRGWLIRKLIDSGHEVDSLTLRKSPENIYKDKIEAISTRYFCIPEGKFSLMGAIRSFIAVYKILKNNKYDVIHLHGHEVAVYFIALSRLLNDSRLIITFTGLGRFFDEGASLTNIAVRNILLLIYKSAAKYVHTFIYLNADDRLLIENYLGACTKSLVLRGEGYEPPVAVNKINKTGIQTNIKVLFASRFLVEKGVLLLLSAIKKQNNEQLSFVLAGTIPANLKSNHHVSDLLSNRIPNCVYVGHVSNMHELLDEVDVVVLPTFYKEGAPRILIEALSSGKFIITTNAPGAKEIIANDMNGIVVPMKDEFALVVAFNALNANRIQAGKIVSEDHFNRHYSCNAIYNNLHRCYFE
jgi:N,N'-diacetylbacillosaminyl-diphospho-undecaprenol alpha-1,3-N-acetylgalactosaminyltransferase